MTDWSQIVEQHGPLVWRTVWRLVSNDADAADCFQRTFVSALELERDGKIRNWPGLLKRLATARAMDCLRERYRSADRLTALAGDALPDGRAADPSRAAEATELADDLRMALVHLDDEQAQVFCLACLEGFKYHQIAEQLGITVNHVGVLLHRARATLQERLRVHRPPQAAPPLKKETSP
jgi:RNA polymerase sigma-70 factor, ECF subfamily